MDEIRQEIIDIKHTLKELYESRNEIKLEIANIPIVFAILKGYLVTRIGR